MTTFAVVLLAGLLAAAALVVIRAIGNEHLAGAWLVLDDPTTEMDEEEID
jgi:hypothetical protein